MSKLDTLKALSCIQHDLKLIENVDLETFRINGQHYYDIAVNLKDIYEDKKHEKIENDDLDKFFNKEQIELLLNVKPLTSQNDFSFYWKKAQEFAKTQPTQVASIEEIADYKRFPVYSETLAAKREELEELLQHEIKLPFLPIRIIPQRVYTFAAASNTGKTFYATGLATNLARMGKKVLLVLTEEDELSFIENTKQIDVDDELWKNISIIEQYTFDPQIMLNLFKTAEKEEFDYVIFDYLKKSVWHEYLSDHVVMEMMNKSISDALRQLSRKIGVFTFVQGNASLAKIESKETLKEKLYEVSTWIDGGQPAYRSAHGFILLYKQPGTEKRYTVIVKARGNQSHLKGKDERYFIKEEDFKFQTYFVDEEEDLFNSHERYGGL